jgi:zinc D-Ala-D-Ala carboxypeptidase
MQLSEHFSLEEMTFSQTAKMRRIDNTASPDIVVNLTNLCVVLEKVRALLKHPVIINSGYRCPLLNEAVGGVKNSAHTNGLAADIECTDFGTPKEVCEFLKDHVAELGIDQLILEFDAWTHIGITDDGHPGRQMVLTIDENGPREGIA